MKSSIVERKVLNAAGRERSVVIRILLVTVAVGSLLSTALPRAPLAPQQVDPSNAKPSKMSNDRFTQSYVELPLGFERNQGQVDRRVKFIGRGAGGDVSLSEAEIIFSLADRALAKNRT